MDPDPSRQQEKGVVLKKFTIFVRNELGHHISSRTGHRWLRKLGLKSKKRGKGVYFDGHERADVVRDRRRFLDYILKLIPRMTHYTEETKEEAKAKGKGTKIAKTGRFTVVDPVDKTAKEIIFVVQDESTAFCNEMTRTVWQEEGRSTGHPKGKGHSRMCSEYMTLDGRLKITVKPIPSMW